MTELKQHLMFVEEELRYRVEKYRHSDAGDDSLEVKRLYNRVRQAEKQRVETLFAVLQESSDIVKFDNAPEDAMDSFIETDVVLYVYDRDDQRLVISMHSDVYVDKIKNTVTTCTSPWELSLAADTVRLAITENFIIIILKALTEADRALFLEIKV